VLILPKFFYLPTDAQDKRFKKNIKISIKLPNNICSHATKLTIHQCILSIITTVTLASSTNTLPDDGD
jgi:hypothetical protein